MAQRRSVIVEPLVEHGSLVSGRAWVGSFGWCSQGWLLALARYESGAWISVTWPDNLLDFGSSTLSPRQAVVCAARALPQSRALVARTRVSGAGCQRTRRRIDWAGARSRHRGVRLYDSCDSAARMPTTPGRGAGGGAAIVTSAGGGRGCGRG